MKSSRRQCWSSGICSTNLLGLEQDSLPQEFQLAGKCLAILQVGGEDRILAVLEPVTARLPDAVAARTVASGAAGQLAQPVELLVIDGRYQGTRVDEQLEERVVARHFEQVPGFLVHCRRVDDHLLAEVGCRAGQRAGAELGKGVSAAIGEHDIVPGLGAAAVAHDEVGSELPREEVDGCAFAFVAESQSLNNHCSLHRSHPLSRRGRRSGRPRQKVQHAHLC